MDRNVSTLNDNLHQEKTFRSDRETYFSTLFSLSCAFMVLGAVENIIVCCVLATGKIGRSPTKLSKFFVLHLAITDLVYRAITFLGRTIDRQNLHSSSTVHCQLAIFSQFTCAAVTFVLLTGIAIDRYIHILFPLRALAIKTRKHLIIIFIWVYALVICSGFIGSATISHRIPRKFRGQLYLFSNSSSYFITNDTVSSDSKPFRRHCTPGKPDSLERKVAFTVYFLFAFVVPLVVITFAYTKITAFLWKRSKTNNSINRSYARTKLKAIQMLVLVVFSFLISWGPIMILDICASYPAKKGQITYQKLPLRPLFDCISQTSSIFYPFIYAFCDANFRKNLRRCCLWRKDSVRVTRVSPVIMNGSCIEMSNLSPKVLRDKRTACNFTYDLKRLEKHLN